MAPLLGQCDDNFAKAAALIAQTAKAEHPDVILLPELWNAGFFPKDAAGCADENGARTRAMMAELAKEYAVNLVAGSVITSRGGRVYNTAYVFDRAGDCIASYDKTHLFTPMGEDRTFAAGDALCRFRLDDGVNCAIIVCYDLRFPELVRTLALPGLDVLFVPAEWPDKRIVHLKTLARARAIENQMFLALSNGCGMANDTRFGGNSGILDPWGEWLAEAGAEETAITAELDLATLTKIRSTIPVFADRRPELYDVDN